MQIIKLSFCIFIKILKTLGFKYPLTWDAKRKKRKLNRVQTYKNRPKKSMLQVENKLSTLKHKK